MLVTQGSTTSYRRYSINNNFKNEKGHERVKDTSGEYSLIILYELHVWGWFFLFVI